MNYDFLELKLFIIRLFLVYKRIQILNLNQNYLILFLLHFLLLLKFLSQLTKNIYYKLYTFIIKLIIDTTRVKLVTPVLLLLAKSAPDHKAPQNAIHIISTI